MKKQQTELLTLKSIRLKEEKGNLYASMYDVLNDLYDSDYKIVKLLDKKLEAGEITSVSDIADWFLARFREEQNECLTLVKSL